MGKKLPPSFGDSELPPSDRQGSDRLRQAGATLPTTPPTMSEPSLSINCFLLGSDPSQVFTVKILKTENVSILKDLIKEEQSPRLNHIVASELTVWKVSLPVDTIVPELTVDKSQKLRSVGKISSIFGEALEDEYVHILVQAPPHPCEL
jgi:hypothetical protein